jgi:hypothetical protein
MGVTNHGSMEITVMGINRAVFDKNMRNPGKSQRTEIS